MKAVIWILKIKYGQKHNQFFQNNLSIAIQSYKNKKKESNKKIFDQIYLVSNPKKCLTKTLKNQCETLENLFPDAGGACTHYT